MPLSAFIYLFIYLFPIYFLIKTTLLKIANETSYPREVTTTSICDQNKTMSYVNANIKKKLKPEIRGIYKYTHTNIHIYLKYYQTKIT